MDSVMYSPFLSQSEILWVFVFFTGAQIIVTVNISDLFQNSKNSPKELHHDLQYKPRLNHLCAVQTATWKTH